MKIKLLITCMMLVSLVSAKTVPSAFYGHKDISDTTFGNSSAITKVLIVSKESDFKERVAHAIADSLASDSMGIIVGGVRKLKSINPHEFKAIVIINTCLSWQIDNKVQSFFRKNEGYFQVVLITTSADPKGCGRGKHVPDYIDAISSASEKDNFAPTVQEALKQVRLFL